MDNQFTQARSTITGAQFSASKSFSSTSFSASQQTASFQQSYTQDLDGRFANKFATNFENAPSNFNNTSNFNSIPSDFQQLSLNGTNQQISNTDKHSFKLRNNFPGGFSQQNFNENDLANVGDVSLTDKNSFKLRNNFPGGFSQQNFSENDFANVSNILLSQQERAQYSNRSVTSTVSSKVIRKKIVRKIVNGEIVEEEEEIDEIENEPVTAQFVEENSANDITRTAVFKKGGKLFDFSSKSRPEIKDTAEVRNKPKAIEPPRDRTTKLKNLFGIGKKKKKGTKDVGNIQPIINELLKTEENYVNDLRIVVDQFMPELRRPDAPAELKEEKGQYALFGNVEIIYMFHDVQFLTDLKESEKNPEDIANCFLKHRREFSLYRHFNRNQPNSEVYVGKYGSFFTDKSTSLQMPVQDIRSYLIKPTQRLCRYTLLLEQLLKECEKHKVGSEDVNTVRQAVDMLRAETRLGNDLMALDAIKNCHMDLKDQGELIYRDPFTVQRGTDPEFKAMVFLFEKIMLFTKSKLESNVDVLHYQDFIYLKDIGLTELQNDSKTFKVWFHKHTLKPYTLKTPDKQLKNKWVEEIRKQLQVELEKTKQEHENNRRTLYNLKDIETDKKNINIIP